MHHNASSWMRTMDAQSVAITFFSSSMKLPNISWISRLEVRIALELLMMESSSSRSRSCSRRYSFSMLTATRPVTSSRRLNSSSRYRPECFLPSTRIAIRRSRLINGTKSSISFDSISSFSWSHRPRKDGMMDMLSRESGFCSLPRYLTTGLFSLNLRPDKPLSRSRGSMNCIRKSSLPVSGKSRPAFLMPMAWVSRVSSSPPCSLRLKTLCILLANSESFWRAS